MYHFTLNCNIKRNRIVTKKDSRYTVFGYSTNHRGKFSNIKCYFKKAG